MVCYRSPSECRTSMRPPLTTPTSGSPRGRAAGSARPTPAPVRRLLELRVGADDPDDLARAAAGLAALGVPSQRRGTSLEATEPVTGVRVGLDVAPRTRQET